MTKFLKLKSLQEIVEQKLNVIFQTDMTKSADKVKKGTLSLHITLSYMRKWWYCNILNFSTKREGV